MRYNIPDDIIINTEIIMNKPIPHTGYRTPLNLRILLSEPVRDMSGRFANNLDTTDKRAFQRFILFKPVSGEILGMLDKIIRFVEDVPEVFIR